MIIKPLGITEASMRASRDAIKSPWAYALAKSAVTVDGVIVVSGAIEGSEDDVSSLVIEIKRLLGGGQGADMLVAIFGLRNGKASMRVSKSGGRIPHATKKAVADGLRGLIDKGGSSMVRRTMEYWTPRLLAAQLESGK